MVAEEAVADVGEPVRDRETAVADVHVVSIDDGVHALTREVLEARWLAEREALLACRFENGARERMLRTHLRACDQPQRLIFAPVGAHEDIGDLRTADRERAGLVEGHGVDTLGCLATLHDRCRP